MQSSYKAMYSSFHTNYFEKFMVINFTSSSQPVVVCDRRLSASSVWFSLKVSLSEFVAHAKHNVAVVTLSASAHFA